MSYCRKLLFLILMHIVINVGATHIVGGVVYYEYLGGNRYKIIFEVYRDCSSNVSIGYDGSCPPSDPRCQLPPLYFGVYEGNIDNNVRYPDNALMLMDTVLIVPVITNPCLEPNGTCVSKGRYETIITLPKNDKGYTIQHQRCCRNNGILNINDQPNTNDKPGITLRTVIPPLNAYTNNSARFRSFPPVFICVNQLFYFDHSATDVDGDQLSYTLNVPLAGLTSTNPADQEQGLPVPNVVWTAPYGLNNVLGGTPALSIDSASGLLVCNPNRAGRFVVSVMVKEHRGGVVIDSFARDFQYNVVDCDIPNANAPFLPGTYVPATRTGVYVRCGNLKVDFANTSTNANRYYWDFGDPASGANNSSTATNPSHVFSSVGTFLVTLIAYKTKSNGRLCSDTTRRICYIEPKPRMFFSFVNTCEDSPLQFTDLSTNVNGPITNWLWDFAGNGSSNIQNPRFTFTTPGTKNVKLSTTVGGCVADTILPVIVYPKPKINAVVPKACLGQPLNLRCQVEVTAPSTITDYRWTFPDGSIFTTCDATYTPPNSSTGSVNLWSKTSFGCVDSANFTYTVNPLPTITASPDITICPNTSTTLTALGGVSYSWSPSTFLSANNIQSPTTTPSTAIRYYVRGTDANGCYNDDSVIVSLFPIAFIDAGSDTSVCLNASAPAFKTTVQLNGKGAFLSQSWTPPANLSDPNILNPIASPSVTTTYILRGVDLNRCIVQDTMTVYALDPTINIVPLVDTFMCQRDTIQIAAVDQGTATSYSWTPNNPFIITNPNARIPFFHPLDTILFTLTASNYCYTITDNVMVNVTELPDPGIPKLDSICVGDIYQFNANPGFSSYQWNTTDNTLSSFTIRNPTASPTITNTYILAVTDRFGCKAADSMTLNVNFPPALSVLGIPKYLCLGDTAELTAFASVFCTYKWIDSSTLSSGSSRIVLANPWDTTNYTVTATTIQKCSTTVPFRINVQGKVIPQADRPVRICQGEFRYLRARGGLFYLWKPSYNIKDTTTDTPQVYPERFTTYTVFISNNCFSDSIKVDVFVDSLPTISAGPDTSIYRGQEISLTARGQAELFDWSPKSEMLSNPFFSSIRVSPRDTTEYIVTAKNGYGCIKVDTINVNVYGRNVLLVPNAFTPNKDGVNELFRIVKRLNIKELRKFEVYNRWGQRVYSTTNINAGWDGSFNGQQSPGDVYVWHIEAMSFDNELIKKSGNVTLIR
jgi:gliding motility-associated-like protein